MMSKNAPVITQAVIAEIYIRSISQEMQVHLHGTRAQGNSMNGSVEGMGVGEWLKDCYSYSGL